MKAIQSDWQRTIWKLVTIPGTELALMFALVMLATWFLVQDDVVLQNAGLPLFPQR